LEIEIPNNEIVDYCYFYRMKYLSPVVFRDLDYDPGGMMMEGRSWEVGSGYRYGFLWLIQINFKFFLANKDTDN